MDWFTSTETYRRSPNVRPPAVATPMPRSGPSSAHLPMFGFGLFDVFQRVIH